MTPDAYCADICRKAGSSFTLSFRLLPAPRRRAMTALYAFCRAVDDVVDDIRDPVPAFTVLQWWRDEVGRLYDGAPRHPVTRALLPAVRDYALPRAHFDAILDGMAMDLQHAGFADFDALRLYCHRVAGVVGLLSARIFGYADVGTETYADKLGLALQLTNIIRDVGEDALRGRIYLPADELRAHGVLPADVLARRETPEFLALMVAQVARARAAYDEALAALPACDRRAQRPGLMMAAAYRTLLDEIEAGGCHVLREKTSLPPLRKALIGLRVALTGRV
ncbi:MAG: presqualene diphosphate synthase HpnD [Rhodocyclaceae bacterium]|nr:presqualene diphosphate synthase HpnD [Rhodocyclaceae bacterium]